MASRYLATVRRAISMPSPFSRSTMRSSDNGCCALSPPTSRRMRERTDFGRDDDARRARRQRRGEEILQLEDAARRGDVLVRGDAAHRALVQLGGDGDVAQHQRLQRAHAVAEEAVLLAHDLARHLEDRRRALLERLDQPVGRLEALGDEVAIGLGARALHQRRVVVAIDQHLGQRVGVELDVPAFLAGVGILGRASGRDRARPAGSARSRRPGRAADRACAAPPACRAGPRRRRRSAGAAGRVRRPPRDRDCRAAPSSPDRGGRARRAGRPGIRRACGQTGRPARSGAAAPTRARRVRASAPTASATVGRIEAAVARLVEALGELQRDAPVGRRRRRSGRSVRAHGPPASAAARRRNRARRARLRAGATLLAAPSPPRSACSRVQRSSASARAGAAAASASAVSAGASTDRGSGSAIGPSSDALFGQQRILFEFLLDEGGEFQVRKLQQLDGLLKLRRHRQRLARRQDETRTDTHVTPTLKVIETSPSRV